MKFHLFPILLILILVVHFQGCWLDFFLDDAGLFGTVSKNILLSADVFQLKLYGKDWLDKPHLPIWCSALSMKILGVNSFAYKLPSFICLILAAYYTYLFVKKKYHRQTAELAVLVFLTAQSSFMTATEGRVANYVALAIIAAIYHVDQALFQKKKNYVALLLTAFWIGFGMMAKGTFVAVFVALAIFGQLVATRKWHNIPYLVLLVPLTFIFILPELYALYLQFDAQPDKMIAGIRWFLWDTQFGHFTNTFEQSSAHRGYFFFAHTLLWTFLPWSVLLYMAWGSAINKKWQAQLPEYYSLLGGLFMFFIFSISRFQLPHYLSVIFPLYAIVVAHFIGKLNNLRLRTILTIFQYLVAIILFVGVLIFQIILEDRCFWIIGLLGCLIIVVVFVIATRKTTKSVLEKAVLVSVVTVAYANIFLHYSFYPLLTSYKGDNQAAFYINTHFPHQKIAVLGHVGHRFEFYTKQVILGQFNLKNIDQIPSNSIILCTDAKILNQLDLHQNSYELIKEFEHYPSESIDLKLLDSNQRKGILSSYFLIKFAK